MATAPVSWLKHWHPHFRDNFFKWLYISDHLEGRVLDGAELEHLPVGSPAIRELVALADMQRSLSYSGQVFVTPPVRLIEQYLLGRRQAEHDDAYRERKALADYTPHFLSAVITLAGMIFAIEQDAKRSWGELGDPEDIDTPIGALWGDADGRGTSYPAVFRRAVVELIAFRETWGRVEGSEFDEDEAIAPPTVSTVGALFVEDFFETENPTEVKTWHQADTRGSIHETPISEKRWWVYFLDRVELWREKSKKGSLSTPELMDTVFYGGTEEDRFVFTSRSSGRAVLPIFREQLSIPGNVGWLMAKKANAIFNMENANDYSLWVASFVKLLADTKDTEGIHDEKLWSELKNTLKSGANLLPGVGHRYIAPPLEGATIRLSVIEQKVRRFYQSFFQSFADQAAIERSATESSQNFRADIEAFLTILSTSADDLENGVLHRLEQITFPDNPEKWGHASVERSRKFVPTDWPAKIEQLVDRTMPGGTKAHIPLDAETLLDIAVRWLKEHGLAVTPEVKERLLPLYENLARGALEKREEPGESDLL